MIEIRPNRLVSFLFDALRVSFYFVIIFYATKFVYQYVQSYVMFLITNNLSADLSPVLFLLSLINLVFESFFYDLAIALIIAFVYSINDRFIFKDGYLYAYEGILFTKERTVPYKSIKEIDYDKAVFDIGSITIRVHEEKKPVKIGYLSEVEEIFTKIKKETGFEAKNKENINHQNS